MNWKEILQQIRNNEMMRFGMVSLAEIEGCWQVNVNHLARRDRKFFRVVGLQSVQSSSPEMKAWYQPVVQEIGVGVVVLVTNTSRSKFLVAARVEPGNPAEKNFVLLGAPLQASESNLQKAHGGKAPRRAELYNHPDVIWADGWKDGDRFLESKNKLGYFALEDDLFALYTDNLYSNELILSRSDLLEAYLAGELNSHLREVIAFALL